MVPTRRSVLTGLSAALVSLGGCSSLLGRSRTRIGELVLVNMDDTGHTIRVHVQSRDETVFHISREVPPVTSGEDPAPVITQQDGLPSAPGRYTISARLDDGEDTIARTYPTKGGNCYSVIVRVGMDGRFRDMPSTSQFDGCTT